MINAKSNELVMLLDVGEGISEDKATLSVSIRNLDRQALVGLDDGRRMHRALRHGVLRESQDADNILLKPYLRED